MDKEGQWGYERHCYGTAWVSVSKQSLWSGADSYGPSILLLHGIITVQVFRNSSLASHIQERELESSRPYLPVAFLVILFSWPGKPENSGYGGLTGTFTSSFLGHNLLLRKPRFRGARMISLPLLDGIVRPLPLQAFMHFMPPSVAFVQC